MKENEEKIPYMKCIVCDTAFMCMITISMKHIGRDNKSPRIVICKTCLKQIKENTKEIEII